MYVTLEPCQMCSGALVQSRIDEVVIGCMNPKAGCAGSVMNLLQIDGFNHQVKITQGVLEEECSEMLSTFFKELREKKKQAKMLKKQVIFAFVIDKTVRIVDPVSRSFYMYKIFHSYRFLSFGA